MFPMCIFLLRSNEWDPLDAPLSACSQVDYQLEQRYQGPVYVPELDTYLPGHLTNGGTGQWGLMVRVCSTQAADASVCITLPTSSTSLNTWLLDIRAECMQKDPVCTLAGCTYERSYIEEVLRGNVRKAF